MKDSLKHYRIVKAPSSLMNPREHISAIMVNQVSLL